MRRPLETSWSSRALRLPGVPVSTAQGEVVIDPTMTDPQRDGHILILITSRPPSELLLPLPASHVVNAFKYLRPDLPGRQPSGRISPALVIAGDDPGSKSTGEPARSIRFDAVYAGAVERSVASSAITPDIDHADADSSAGPCSRKRYPIARGGSHCGDFDGCRRCACATTETAAAHDLVALHSEPCRTSGRPNLHVSIASLPTVDSTFLRNPVWCHQIDKTAWRLRPAHLFNGSS